MKYGPRRIAILAAIIIMLFLTGFYWYDAEQKQNSRVIKKVNSEMTGLLKSSEIASDIKGLVILVAERYDSGYIDEFLNNLDAKERVDLGIEIYKSSSIIDKHDSSAFKNNLKSQVQKDLGALQPTDNSYLELLTSVNKFSSLLNLDNYYNPSKQNREQLTQTVDQGYQLVNKIFRDTSLFKSTSSSEINYAIDQWLCFGNADSVRIDSLIAAISPLTDSLNRPVFNYYYPKGNYELNGDARNDYNGGYQVLAFLAAARGDVKQLVTILDKIRQTSQVDFFNRKIVYNSCSNIIGTLYKFGYGHKKQPVIEWMQSNIAGESPLKTFDDLISKSGYYRNLYNYNIFRGGGNIFQDLNFIDEKVFDEVNADYEKIIGQLPNQSQQHFLLAMNFKRKALYKYKNNFDRGLTADTSALNNLLETALAHYRLVDKGYLDEKVQLIHSYFINGLRVRDYSRRQVFLYPDYMGGWFSHSYHSDLFFKFLCERNLVNELYTTPEDLSMVHLWLAKANDMDPYPNVSVDNRFQLPDKTIEQFFVIANSNSFGKSIDLTLPAVMLANRSFSRGDTTNGMKYYKLINRSNLAVPRAKYEYLEKTYLLNQLKDLCANLAVNGRQEEAIDLAEKFEYDYEKAFAYIDMSEQLYTRNADPLAFVYLDSVFAKSRDIDFSQSSFDNRLDHRYKWILLLSRIGGRKLNKMADDMILDILQGNRMRPMALRAFGIAEEGNFYRAKQSLPATLTETQELIARAWLIWEACRKKETAEQTAKWKSMDKFMTHLENYIFFVPN